MSDQTTDASHGVKWLSDGLSLFLKNPGPFALMGLILGVVGLVPLLGALALMILAPALYAGLMFAYREQSGGRKVEVGQLFSAFNQEGKLAKLLPLCLPGIAAAIVAGIIMVVVLFGALVGAGGAAAMGKMSSTAGLMHLLASAGIVTAFIAVIMVAGVMLLSWALLFTAIPRVMFDDVEPFAAMKESFGRAKANLVAYVVFALVTGVAFVVLQVVISTVSGLLAGLVMSAVGTPIIVAGIYSAYRQLFPGSADAALPEPSADVPPAAPAADSPASEEAISEPDAAAGDDAASEASDDDRVPKA